MNAVSPNTTHMAREITEIPAVVRRQIADGLAIYREEGERLHALDPRLVVTCARGTSDHAATFFKYLTEARLGVPVASIGPSVGSVYGARMRLAGAACLTISQSGGSPDLVTMQGAAREGGARTVAFLNVADSPVASGADAVLPMLAGPEKAVAATKSYVASLVALAAVHTGFAGDAALLAAIERLPESLEVALAQDWTEALVPVAMGTSLFTVSRGPGLSVAGEAALKFKETCRLHAEAYSAAEVRHGPIALARDRFAAIVFVPQDESRAGVLEAAAIMRGTGARVLMLDQEEQKSPWLATAKAPHPALAPICQAVSFYRFIERLSAQLGENPDAPLHLQKVTRTT